MRTIERRIRIWVLLLAVALPMGSCGGDGAECDRCTSDAECAAGSVCSTFSDGSQRCGSGQGETSCRVR